MALGYPRTLTGINHELNILSQGGTMALGWSRILTVLLLMGLSRPVFAAPPTLSYLEPAGAPRGSTTTLTFAGTLDASTQVWVSDAALTVQPTKEKNRFALTVDANAVPGVYWLRAYNSEGASALRPFIVGLLPEVAEKEPNDDFQKPHRLDTTAVTINGKLDKNGDVDCYALPLKRGQTLIAALEAHQRLRSPLDCMMQVLSAEGFVLEENNDFRGLDPQVVFTAPHDGTYIVRVYAFPATPDASIRYFGTESGLYRLTLTTGPYPDHAVPLAFREADVAHVQVAGWNRPTESGPIRFVREKHDSRFGILLAPQWADGLRVRHEPHPGYGVRPPLTPPEPLSPPFSITGRIETKKGEVRIPFDAKKGQNLTIYVESRSWHLEVNPVLRVLDQQNQQLARAEPAKINADVTLAFTPPADGRYTLAITDLYGGGGPRHVFLARILSEPDYELTVSTDRFVLTPDQPTIIPVKLNRLRGFQKPVELTVEGVPESVQVAITTPAKADPNTISLSLTANQPVNTAFRIIGTVKDEPSLTRIARAPYPDFDETTPHLWLGPSAATTPPKKKRP